MLEVSKGSSQSSMELKKYGEVKELQGLKKDMFSLSPDTGDTRVR